MGRSCLSRIISLKAIQTGRIQKRTPKTPEPKKRRSKPAKRREHKHPFPKRFENKKPSLDPHQHQIRILQKQPLPIHAFAHATDLRPAKPVHQHPQQQARRSHAIRTLHRERREHRKLLGENGSGETDHRVVEYLAEEIRCVDD